MVKSNKGITLIALVITIVVLLILAGATLAIVFNEGLIDKTENAVSLYSDGEKKELDELRQYQTFQQLSGEIMAEIVNDGGTTTAKLISDGNGDSFYLPVGFYYVGGVVEDGVVISDNEADNEKYLGLRDIGKDLVGNQYVWVPVNKRETEYIKHVYATPVVNDASRKVDTGNGSWATVNYRKFKDWKDMEITGSHNSGTTTIYDYADKMAENIASIEKYKGFYISRYEAGFAPATAGTQHYDKYTKNNANKAPESKANYQAWSSITQANAALACKKLNEISNYSNVKAGLIDSVAWDRTIHYISKKLNSITDSCSYGGYSNGTIKENHVIYYPFIHIYERANGSAADWYQTRLYKDSGDAKIQIKYTEMNTDALKNEVKEILGVDTLENAKYRKYIELATGTSDSTKINNIYDLAGNLWEWTTEIGKHSTTNSDQNRTTQTSENSYGVLRGGAFDNNGNSSSICYRNGGVTVLNPNRNIGFRSVLYIK